jgi:hypothetical protein|eukprot:SAG25_NODE_419_length_8245_cov_3.527744_9_plen_65_part_00
MIKESELSLDGLRIAYVFVMPIRVLMSHWSRCPTMSYARSAGIDWWGPSSSGSATVALSSRGRC